MLRTDGSTLSLFPFPKQDEPDPHGSRWTIQWGMITKQLRNCGLKVRSLSPHLLWGKKPAAHLPSLSTAELLSTWPRGLSLVLSREFVRRVSWFAHWEYLVKTIQWVWRARASQGGVHWHSMPVFLASNPRLQNRAKSFLDPAARARLPTPTAGPAYQFQFRLICFPCRRAFLLLGLADATDTAFIPESTLSTGSRWLEAA